MITKRYRVNGNDMYTMHYEKQQDGTWKISNSEHPYNPFSGNVVKYHLYDNGDISVTAGCEPRSLDKAKAIASVWMEGFSVYVKSGKFPTGTKRVNV